jgi:hypothetical protein
MLCGVHLTVHDFERPAKTDKNTVKFVDVSQDYNLYSSMSAGSHDIAVFPSK